MSPTNKEIVQKVNDSFIDKTPQVFLDYCADDIQWTMAGKPPLNGKEDVLKVIDYMKGYTDMEMSTNHLIAEGDLVSCSGIMSMKGPDGRPYKGAFCDIYRFRDGRIAEMTSYVVSLDGETAE